MTHESVCFFFNYPTISKIYTLSLHDALPICAGTSGSPYQLQDIYGLQGVGSNATTLGYSYILNNNIDPATNGTTLSTWNSGDRKSTRLNSSHVSISYAVFCLKKKTDRLMDCK